MKPREYAFDIETAPSIGLWFGKPYDVNIAKTIQHEYVFGFAGGWMDDKKIHSCYIWDFPAYHKKLDIKGPTLRGFLEALDKRIRECSIEVLKVWSEDIKNSRTIIGHNSDQFDYKHMFGRLAQYGLPPVPRPQMIDTKKMAKQIGNYPSNKLDDLGERFGTGRKLEHKGYPNAIDLWWDCMNDVLKAQAHMVKYNKIDVQRTKDLYLSLRPYATTHPNMAAIYELYGNCPRCSEGPLRPHRDRITAGGIRKVQVQCENCGHYSTQRKQEKQEKTLYV